MKTKRLLAPILSFVILLSGMTPGFMPAATAHAAGMPSRVLPEPGPDIKVLEETAGGISFELILPAFELTQELVNGQDCHSIALPNSVELPQPGSARLPIRGVLLHLPAGMQAVMTVDTDAPVTLPGRYNLCPVPQPQLQETQNLLAEVEYTAQANPEAYASQEFLPAQTAVLHDPAQIQTQTVVQVRLQPFQYRAAAGEVRYVPRIRVHIVYQPLGQRPTSAVAAPVAPNMPTLGLQTYQLSLNQDGIYQVSYADLLAAGANLSSATGSSLWNTLQLFNHGSEVALEFNAGDDNSFDPGDTIRFYGTGIDTQYSDENVYWLTWGVQAGKRIALSSATPNGGPLVSTTLASQVAESNLLYVSAEPDELGGVWYWKSLAATSAPVTANFPITLTEVDQSTPFSATLRLRMTGGSASPYHHTQVYVNNTLVHDMQWPSNTQSINTLISFPGSVLLSGSNSIMVVLPRDGFISSDNQYVNSFEIGYQRSLKTQAQPLPFWGRAGEAGQYALQGFQSEQVLVYDVTEPATPSRLTGGSLSAEAGGYTLVVEPAASATPRRYLALAQDQALSPKDIHAYQPNSLTSIDQQADYLLITHRDFYTDVLPLADWRRQQGLTVNVVTTQAIYDSFNHGIFDAQAIRDFIAYAYSNWQKPAPIYVLLVGDGQYDMRNYTGTNTPTFVPPYLLPVDYFIGQTASDNRYVTVSGSDNLADLYIGRLPVNTRPQAQTVVQKLIAYDQTPTDTWNGQMLFVADNTDSGGAFNLLSDKVADQLVPARYTANKAYYLTNISTTTTMRSEIISQINTGRLLVNYVGHGATLSWATEKFLNALTLSGLTNNGRLTFVVQMACLTSAFHNPSPVGKDFSALSEALVRLPNAGAIATWGSTGLGLASGQDYLNRGLFDALFYKGQSQLGPAVTQAKQFLYSQTGAYLDLQDTFILLGDPATQLKLPPTIAPTPVQVSGLQATATDQGMAITWQTGSELDLVGFNLYRQTLNGERQRLNPDLIQPQFAGGLNGQAYSYLDSTPNLQAGQTYWLEVITRTSSEMLAADIITLSPVGRLYLPLTLSGH